MKTRKLICFALAAVMMLCAVPALAAGNSGWGTTPQYVPESALEMTLSNTIYFNSKRNAETVKHIIEVDDSKPNNATVCEMEEIKHGSWKYDSEGVGYANYLCSECKNFLTFYEDIDLYPYCPYCGVKMDKE